MKPTPITVLAAVYTDLPDRRAADALSAYRKPYIEAVKAALGADEPRFSVGDTVIVDSPHTRGIPGAERARANFRGFHGEDKAVVVFDGGIQSVVDAAWLEPVTEEPAAPAAEPSRYVSVQEAPGGQPIWQVMANGSPETRQMSDAGAAIAAFLRHDRTVRRPGGGPLVARDEADVPVWDGRRGEFTTYGTLRSTPVSSTAIKAGDVLEAGRVLDLPNGADIAVYGRNASRAKRQTRLVSREVAQATGTTYIYTQAAGENNLTWPTFGMIEVRQDGHTQWRGPMQVRSVPIYRVKVLTLP